MVATSKKGRGTTARSRTPSQSTHPAAKGAPGSTRTSTRSAKRRSPKEPELDPEVLEYERLEFLRAMDRYKRQTGKTFPSWTEVLEVLRSIGWMHPRRVEEEVARAQAKVQARAGG